MLPPDPSFPATALVVALLSYVVGATPFGWLAGKWKGIDIREHGSRNIGATNVIRVLGKGVGIPVFILDMLKGLVPVLLATRWGWGHPELGATGSQLLPVIAGLSAVLGHNFTFWLRFKGGKGVATSAGIMLGLAPFALLICLAVWLAVFRIWRYVALASIVAGVVLPLAVAGLGVWRGVWNTPLFVLALLTGVLAVVRHRSNIQRLLAGTENKFERRKKA